MPLFSLFFVLKKYSYFYKKYIGRQYIGGIFKQINKLIFLIFFLSSVMVYIEYNISTKALHGSLIIFKSRKES